MHIRKPHLSILKDRLRQLTQRKMKEEQPGLIARKEQVGDWQTGMNYQDSSRHQLCCQTVHVASIVWVRLTSHTMLY